MEKFFSRLKHYCDNFKLDYQLVDIDGKVLFSNYGDESTINISTALKDPLLTVFPIQNSNFIGGYVITASQLSYLEKSLLGHFTGTLASLHALEHGGATRYNSLNFWRNVLYHQIEEDELLTYCERHHINLSNCFLVLFIKITPPIDLPVTDINYIQDLIQGYCGTYKTVYNTLLHPGELILIIELPRDEVTVIEKTEHNLQIHGHDIIERLQRLTKFSKKNIIIGVSETVEYFRDIAQAFGMLKNLIDTATKLDMHSRVVLYNHLPIYSLLQGLSASSAQKFVHTIFKNLNPLKKHFLITLEVLFLSNLNISLAAKKLRLHRNTLEYRLHKIHSLTQLNPMNMYDAAQLMLAIQLKKLYNI